MIEALLILPMIIGFVFALFVLGSANSSLNKPCKELEELREQVERGER